MFCPEGYFTPSMLSTAFEKAMAWPLVRDTVYETNALDATAIHSAHLKAVLGACSQVFLHWFIVQSNNELRLCQSRTGEVVRIDPWAVKANAPLPKVLPTTHSTADEVSNAIQSRLPFIDQELWVLDVGRLHAVKETNASVARIELLFRDLDGWSLCFEQRSWPKDVGATMKSYAAEMARQREIPQITPKKNGRPGKVEDVIDFLDAFFPKDSDLPPYKEIQRKLVSHRDLKVGTTTIANALRHRRENN